MKTILFVSIFHSGKSYESIAGGQSIDEDYSKCNTCHSWIDNRIVSKNLIIKLDYLGRLGFSPFLWNSHQHEILRDDVLKTWERERITGYQTGTVQFSGWYSNTKKEFPTEIPTYHNVVSDNLVQLSIPKKIGRECPICGHQEYGFPKIGTYLPNGISIDINSWNGTDVTTVQGYSIMIYSEKAVRATLNAGFGAFLPFVRLEKYLTWDMFDIRKRSPKEYNKYLEQFLIRKVDDLSDE